MKKNFVLMLFLGILMCIDIHAIEIAYLQTPEGIAYSVNENDEIVVEGSAGYVNKLVIPDMIDGKPVRYINEYAFYGNPNITSVKITDNVIQIGADAFGNCQELRTVKLPANLEVIEASTFAKCGMLSKIDLPDTLKSIGDYAFEACTRLRKLKIPASVEFIGHESFIACESLLLDSSENEYAAEYAVLNGIETDFKSSWEYVLLTSVVLTIGVGVVCFLGYMVVKRFIKRK